MGKGRVLFTSAIFSAFLIGLLANSFSAQAGGNCQSKLVGNTYNCDQSEQGFAGGPFTAEFETGGYSEYFDMFIDAAEYGCACNTTGSVGSPKYDSSSSDFGCISLLTGYFINGKVSGKKITGQGSAEDGKGFIYSCTKE
ncbi:hypothetical protein [Candidatus Binatus sp.]|uniref:hypothetical protein n=1 Tax=Candidatus Binatus sp. TaxID=2811406 RepID=UPI003F98D215